VKHLALLCCLLAGCASTPPQSIALCKDIRYGVAFWRAEITRVTGDRNPITVTGHGAYAPDGTWTIYPDYGKPIPVETFARSLKCVYPTQIVWLVVCNERGHDLPMSGVAYPKAIVWAMPDRWCPNPSGPEAGRVDEFVIRSGSPFEPTTKPTRQ
jgi:hypothetical protein